VLAAFHDAVRIGVEAVRELVSRVEDPSLPKAELEAFVREAHEKVCPYSHATRGNVAVNFTVVGA